MSGVKMVCLASSRKNTGRCVAGRSFRAEKFGKWVRVVSARPTRELQEGERVCEDGTSAKVLDIVEVPILQPAPEHYQTENQLLDTTQGWRRLGRVTWDALQSAVEEPETLWVNGHSSSYLGENDRVPLSALGSIRNSLYLIRPSGLLLRSTGVPDKRGRTKVRIRAEFEFRGQRYNLAVTDPELPWVLKLPLLFSDGTVAVPQGLLCVSLGEVFDGFAYKLVATIICPGE